MRYFDTAGQAITRANGDFAILTASEHIATLPPIQALAAAASPIDLFAWYGAEEIAIPVGRVEDDDAE